VQALEAPLPPPFRWAARARPSAPAEPYLIMCTDEGASYETANHPHLMELRRTADTLRQQLLANGGEPDYSILPPTARSFATPRDGFSPEPSSSRDGGSDSELGSSRRGSAPPMTPLDGLTPREFEEAFQYAAVMENSRTPRAGDDTPRQQPSFDESSGAELDAQVFLHCISGSVHNLKRYLEMGGYADKVYKPAYGWDEFVGADWTHTKPNDGVSFLNYVATWSDVIGEPAVEMARLLLHGGADLLRDDGLELWFNPLHNAVANGASEMVAVMLDAMPDAVNLTTGDGRTPLHVLALCDEEQPRYATLEVLLRRRQGPDGSSHVASLNSKEPFHGQTALHMAAREGHTEVVIRLLEAGAPASEQNDAGHDPLDEARAELAALDAETQPTATQAERHARLFDLISKMEIAVLAY